MDGALIMNTLKRILITAVVSLVNIVSVMAGTLPYRPNTTTTIAALPTGRLSNITDLWGGYNTTTVGPDFGMLIWSSVMTYQDAIGQIAWVIIFAIPFVMMWINQMDMTMPAIIGMLFSLYVFTKLPSQYIVFGVGAFVICIAALLWSLYKRAF